jgi:molybdopterin-synthase adenylyltransferase
LNSRKPYSRQIVFPEIGEEGQKRIKNSLAVVLGCGGLGTAIASGLVRAGVGTVRIIDRDYIEISNLQRQNLFDEEDIRSHLPKAVAAKEHLKKVNSEIKIQGLVADVSRCNIEALVEGADVILDAFDNFAVRLLLNDTALKLNIPWIHGGAIAARGMSMTIIPHKTACYRCLVDIADPDSARLKCETAGILGPAVGVVGNIQVAEALKVLVGSNKINPGLLIMDVWENNFQRLRIDPRPGCPACEGRYEYLEVERPFKYFNSTDRCNS